MTSAYLDALRPVSPTVTTNQGGTAYEADDFARITRFLILGSEGGTYYIGQRELTLANADVVKRCLDADPTRTITMIRDVSTEGRAPKNDPAILALAIAASHADELVRHWAFQALPAVCRTGTHLLHFMAYCKQVRKSSRMYRTAIGNWFNQKDADQLAYQAVKYKQRDGWSLADALRLARPTAPDEAHNAVYKYIVDGKLHIEHTPALIRAAEDLSLHNGDLASDAIREYRLPREAVPTELLNRVDIWDALLADMPMTAMIRNLAKMTNVGLITGDMGNEATYTITSRLADAERIQNARVHPLQILAALKVYEQGHGEKGKLTWTPVKRIVNALDEAFYMSFKAVPSTGKRILLALDVSSSMDGSQIAGMPFISAMALVTANVEPSAEFVAYSHDLVGVTLRPSMRLDEVIRTISAIPMGGTLCALPIWYADRAGEKFDAFVSYTDSETGRSPMYGFGYNRGISTTPDYTDALARYRGRVNKQARSVVVALTANQFTLNDPLDPMGLDVAGFDSAAPGIIGDFIGGRI